MKIENNNNSVLITGGTQGLGFEIANKLVENGCNEIIIAGRNEKKGAQAELPKAPFGVPWGASGNPREPK